jgi:hypothetical protein
MSGLLGSLQGGGCQLGDKGDGPLAEFGQYVPEVCSQIDAQPTASLHDRGDGDHFGAGLFAPNVQPVLAVNS